jgi:FkbM family methyltransferase
MGVLAGYMPQRALRARSARLRANTNGDTVVPVLDFRMHVDPSDPGISTDLMLDGIREAFATEALIGELGEGDVALDIGANIGYYALQESRMVGKTGCIYAVEPVPGNVEVLRRNVLLNGADNVSVFQFAVGDRDFDTTINISTMRNMCSMVEKKGYRGYIGKVPVRVVKLDTFLEGKRQPKLVRMDVEGYELEILIGAKKLLGSGKPLKLFIEVHFDILLDRTAQLLDLLEEYGFGVKWATFERHPAVRGARFGSALVQWLDGAIGASTGHNYLTMRELYDKRFISGQVEDMEIMFERK